MAVRIRQPVLAHSTNRGRDWESPLKTSGSAGVPPATACWHPERGVGPRSAARRDPPPEPRSQRMNWMEQAAERAEQRLRQAGIALTLGGEPTYIPLNPEGAEWTVAADGPTKLSRARAMAAAIQRRTWPGSTLLYCSGKRYEGEVNPRWALRLVTRRDGQGIAPWPAGGAGGRPLLPEAAETWLQALGRRLGTTLHPLPLTDPGDPDRRVWAAPLSWQPASGWRSAPWALDAGLRQLVPAPGPAGLRLPLEHFPPGIPCQLLTLEICTGEWGVFLPPLERQPTELLLQAISSLALNPAWGAPLSPPLYSGLLPVDAAEGWQVLGLTADPGVLEVNLPVCHSWAEYRQWLTLLEEAAEEVGLCSWRGTPAGGQRGTGGGNHLLWGGPDLERNPLFSRPAWLAGILRYFQHHPSLSYLFSGEGVGPASQSPRADEALGSLLDLELAYAVLERCEPGDQRWLIGETLRHLHADRSGNNHRAEVSFDKFWNPAAPAGCLGLIEFRAIESLPSAEWMAAIALLWSSIAALLLDPQRRPAALRDWGADLHDRMLLPSQLRRDLQAVLDDLAGAGLPLQAEPFEAIWGWRFPLLLHWHDPASGAVLQVRQALEPWPLICDTPREGGFTSRFVDASMRRVEISCNDPFRQAHRLRLQSRPLPLPSNGQPVAVRWREQRLYPCLHPGIPPQGPLLLELEPRRTGGDRQPLGPRWQLPSGAARFEPLSPASPAGSPSAEGPASPDPWPTGGGSTIDLRQALVADGDPGSGG